MIAVKDINRYELHFRQFMLMANTVTGENIISDNQEIADVNIISDNQERYSQFASSFNPDQCANMS